MSNGTHEEQPDTPFLPHPFNREIAQTGQAVVVLSLIAIIIHKATLFVLAVKAK